MVDSTATTPVLIKPKEFGAHIVIHSTSKFINGHGNAIGGAIIDTGNYNWAKGRYPEISATCKESRANGIFGLSAKFDISRPADVPGAA